MRGIYCDKQKIVHKPFLSIVILDETFHDTFIKVSFNVTRLKNGYALTISWIDEFT